MRNLRKLQLQITAEITRQCFLVIQADNGKSLEVNMKAI